MEWIQGISGAWYLTEDGELGSRFASIQTTGSKFVVIDGDMIYFDFDCADIEESKKLIKEALE